MTKFPTSYQTSGISIRSGQRHTESAGIIGAMDLPVDAGNVRIA
jgi:hypothetical protein